MKKSITIVCLAFIGCDFSSGPGPTDRIVINQSTVYTYVIDGCEYLGNLSSPDNRAYYLAHKGNCKNKIHDTSNN